MPDQRITSSPFRLSLILGLLLTGLVFLAIRQSEQQRLSTEPDIAVNERRLALQSSFDEITEIMRGPARSVRRKPSSRLHQVFGNLLSNAAKFSAAGKPIQIQAEVRAGCVRICVIDQGAGIPREFHDQVFEKFTQADSTDTRRSGGTGLGLSICRSIVTQHGGRIDFISEPDQGTTFYVELPLPDPDTSDLAAARQHPRRHSA